jgi:phosphohistidine phosphatase SixA
VRVKCLLAFVATVGVACTAAEGRGVPVHESARSPIVLIVRHADKAVAATNDPPLSDAGQTRAAALADALRDAGVTRIIVDQSQRTRETAAPISQRQALQPEVVPIDWNDPEPQVHAIADALTRPGSVTLVIGHRNTVPAIIRALGGPVITEMKDADYDDLYVVVPDAGPGAPVVIHASYGRGSTGPR